MNFLDEIKSMLASKKAGECPFCKKRGPFTFKNEVSHKEYSLSGLCQECQDEFFETQPPPP